MASTFTTNLGIEKPATGDKAGTWGTATNVTFDLLDEAIENAATQAGDPALSERPGALAHTCGGLEWLRFLRADIERHGPGFHHD